MTDPKTGVQTSTTFVMHTIHKHCSVPSSSLIDNSSDPPPDMGAISGAKNVAHSTIGVHNEPVETK